MKNYDSTTDQELAYLVKNGDKDAFSALSTRYLPVLHARAGRYSNIVGVEMEDFLQEGLLALFRAAMSFRENEQAQFRTYAITCINNSLSSAIQLHFRQSRQTQLFEHEHSDSNPVEDLLIDRESSHERAIQINELLSGFERQVLRLYLRGQSYQQISEVLSTATKSVDNALQRVRKKLRPHFAPAQPTLPVSQPKGCR